MNRLDQIFEELGISQYLGAFVDNGFDSWETILDITESDLYVARGRYHDQSLMLAFSGTRLV